MTPTDDDLRRILGTTRVIALVGASANPDRPSHRVGWSLARRGYRVIPVNPGLAGQSLFGETVVARLSDIPADASVDMVDIFRRSEEVGPVVDAALAALPSLRTVWMQLGVVNQAAAEAARAKGVEVVMDRCPAIEIPRLGVEAVR
jgi:predicted CoA-binding protein